MPETAWGCCNGLEAKSLDRLQRSEGSPVPLQAWGPRERNLLLRSPKQLKGRSWWKGEAAASKGNREVRKELPKAEGDRHSARAQTGWEEEVVRLPGRRTGGRVHIWSFARARTAEDTGPRAQGVLNTCVALTWGSDGLDRTWEPEMVLWQRKDSRSVPKLGSLLR